MFDDEQRLEELRDLIDDNPIEEDNVGGDSDSCTKKRKKTDDEGLDDQLEEDHDFIEENCGLKVARRIRNNDIPERMHNYELYLPVTPVLLKDRNELNEEAELIYSQAFCKPTVSTQDSKGDVDPRTVTKKGNITKTFGYFLKKLQSGPKDVHMHFLLYCSHLIPKMQEKKHAKEREERRQARK